METSGSYLPGPTPSWIPLSFPGILPFLLPYGGIFQRWRLCNLERGFWIPVISAAHGQIKPWHEHEWQFTWIQVSRWCNLELMKHDWPWENPPELAGPFPGSLWSTSRAGTGTCGNRSASGPSCPEGYSCRPPPCPVLAAPGRKYKLRVCIRKTGKKTWDRPKWTKIAERVRPQISFVYMLRIPFDPDV